MESKLSLSELKRLTSPYTSEAAEREAFEYWYARTMQERLEASMLLTEAFYRWRGVDSSGSARKFVRLVARDDSAHMREQELEDAENERLWPILKSVT